MCRTNLQHRSIDSKGCPRRVCPQGPKGTSSCAPDRSGPALRGLGETALAGLEKRSWRASEGCFGRWLWYVARGGMLPQRGYDRAPVSIDGRGSEDEPWVVGDRIGALSRRFIEPSLSDC